MQGCSRYSPHPHPPCQAWTVGCVASTLLLLSPRFFLCPFHLAPGSLDSPLLFVKTNDMSLQLEAGVGPGDLCSLAPGLDPSVRFLSVSVFGNLLQSRPCSYYILQVRGEGTRSPQVHGRQAVVVLCSSTVWKQGFQW